MVVEKLKDEKALKEARIHPVTVLLARATYVSGGGHRGKLTWIKNEMIEDALEHAFYASFSNVTPTNKRYCLAVDVSGITENLLIDFIFRKGVAILQEKDAFVVLLFTADLMHLHEITK